MIFNRFHQRPTCSGPANPAGHKCLTIIIRRKIQKKTNIHHIKMFAPKVMT